MCLKYFRTNKSWIEEKLDYSNFLFSHTNFVGYTVFYKNPVNKNHEAQISEILGIFLRIILRLDHSTTLDLVPAFKAIYGLAPKYVCDLVIVKPKSKNSLRSSSELLLRTPNIKTLVTLGDRAFCLQLRNCETLYPIILEILSHLVFLKNRLKTYLFELTFPKA